MHLFVFEGEANFCFSADSLTVFQVQDHFVKTNWWLSTQSLGRQGNDLCDQMVRKRVSDERSKESKSITNETFSLAVFFIEDGSGPVRVSASVFIRHIEASKLKMRVHARFTFSWKDSRLAFLNYENRFITLRSTSLLWLPDIFIINEDLSSPRGHKFPIIHIFRDGRVVYTLIRSVPLYCEPTMYLIPGESMCSIIMASLFHPREELLMSWESPNAVEISQDAVAQEGSQKLIPQATMGECSVNETNSSCLEAIVKLAYVTDENRFSQISGWVTNPMWNSLAVGCTWKKEKLQPATADDGMWFYNSPVGREMSYLRSIEIKKNVLATATNKSLISEGSTDKSWLRLILVLVFSGGNLLCILS